MDEVNYNKPVFKIQFLKASEVTFPKGTDLRCARGQQT